MGVYDRGVYGMCMHTVPDGTCVYRGGAALEWGGPQVPTFLYLATLIFFNCPTLDAS